MIIDLLDDGLPHTAKELVAQGILGKGAAYQGLTRTWKCGLIIRTKMPIAESELFSRESPQLLETLE